LRDCFTYTLTVRLQLFTMAYKSARKLPQKREILIVQVEFGKIISIERIE
jgi:hypothetical protein